MAGSAAVDALPYVDQEYDVPALREAALLHIEEETRRYRPTKNYLEYLPTPKTTFVTPILQAELTRLAAHHPMDTLSMSRYELPQPGAMQKNDVGAWKECVKNSYAQLEHQRCRIDNLELLSKYGTDEWKLHNQQLSVMTEYETNTLKNLRNQVRDVNWQRKTEQTAAGGQLASLTNSWNTLVHKNFEIKMVCTQLEGEVAYMKKHAQDRGLIKD